MKMDFNQRELQSYLDFLFNPLHSAVLIIDANYQVQYLNHAAEGLFASSLKSSWHQPLVKLIPKENLIFFHIQEVINSGANRLLHDFSIHVRDKIKTVQVEIAPLGSIEKIQGILIYVSDFGLPQSLKEELRVRDRIAMMGTMALGLAHEIRNPLGGIRGAAQMIAKESDLQERLDFANIIIKEVDRLNALLTQLLDFEKPRILQLSPINLNQILDEVLYLQKAEIQDRLVIEKHFDPSLPPVLADSGALKQALLNLIKNAVEAMPKQGRLYLRTKFNRDTKKLFTQNNKRAAVAELVIKDSGPGIKKKHLDSLFTPFFTTKAQGTGLGLMVTQKIIHEHHGYLEIETQPQQGTEVRVYLPFAV